MDKAAKVMIQQATASSAEGREGERKRDRGFSEVRLERGGGYEQKKNVRN